MTALYLIKCLNYENIICLVDASSCGASVSATEAYINVPSDIASYASCSFTIEKASSRPKRVATLLLTFQQQTFPTTRSSQGWAVALPFFVGVLLKLVTPPVVTVPLIPFEGPTAAAELAVQAGYQPSGPKSTKTTREYPPMKNRAQGQGGLR